MKTQVKLREVIQTNSLPVMLKKSKTTRWRFSNAEKICECGTKDIYKEDTEPKFVYCHMAIYYNKNSGDYYHLVKHRDIKSSDDSLEEFKKKAKLSKKNTKKWELYNFDGIYASGQLGQDMITYLRKIYNEHVAKMKEINDKAAAERAVRYADEVKKQNKRNAKIVDSFHSDDGYSENWSGISL